MGELSRTGYSPLNGWKNILLIIYFLSKPLITQAYIGLNSRHAFQLELAEDNYGTRLSEMIKINASKYVRPVLDQTKTLNVTFRLNLYQILAADAVNQHIHLHFWAEMTWYNEFTSWDPEDYGNIQRLDFEPKYMWIPDVMFFNQLSGQHFNEHFPAPPSILHTGETVVLKPFRVELECRLEVLHFPFDKQRCAFEVGSWAHFSHEIFMEPKRDDNGNIHAADLRFFKNSSIFALEDFSVEQYTYSDPEFGESFFNGLRYVIRFHRYTAYFVINLIMPSFMINVLCIFNFMIPCSSGEKAGYGITVFLAQSVNLMVVMEMMPQGGVSILGMFLAVSIALIGLSLLMNIVTLRVYSPQDSRLPPSPRLRKLGRFLQFIVGPRDVPSDIVLSQNNFLKLSDTFYGALSLEDFTNVAANENYLLHSNSENKFATTKLFDQMSSKPPYTTIEKSGKQQLAEFRMKDFVNYVPVNQQNGLKPVSTSKNSKNNYKDADLMTENFSLTSDPTNFQKPPALNSSSPPEVPVSVPATPFKGDPNNSTDAVVTNTFPRKRQNRPGQVFSSKVSPDHTKFQGFIDDAPVSDKKQKNYTAEYQFLAETINRFNAIIFSALLILVCCLYWIYHEPSSFPQSGENGH